MAGTMEVVCGRICCLARPVCNFSVQLTTPNPHNMAEEWTGLIVYAFSSVYFQNVIGA